MSTQATSVRPDLGRTGMSPRRKAELSRWAQYALLVVLAVVAVLVVDWGRVGNAFFNPEAIRALAPRLPRAALNTVVYTAAAFAVGLLLGLLLALMTLSSVRVYRVLARGWIEFFRGVPALLVIFAFGYGVPTAFGVRFDSIVLTVAIALGIVSSAYIAETLRAGIQAVPRGQVEAARSLGMSSGRTMRQVVVPQAARIVLPPLTNEAVLLVKDTSLVFGLGLFTYQMELTRVGRDGLNFAGGGLTAVVVVGLVYLLITVPLGAVTRWLERRTSTKGAR